MCVIMVKAASATLSEETLAAGWYTNPDGAGVAYVDDGKVIIDKGHMQLGAFMDAYRKIPKDRVHMVHFRIRTHGKQDEERTHPFRVGKDGEAALMHNGILSCVEDDDVLSDTQIFLHKYPGLFYDEKKLGVWSESIGSKIGYSKFAVLYPSGRFYIVNAHLGKWIDGVWYSNTYWRSAVGSVSAIPRTSLYVPGEDY